MQNMQMKMLYGLFNTLALFQNYQKEGPFRKNYFSSANTDSLQYLSLPRRVFFHPHKSAKYESLHP